MVVDQSHAEYHGLQEINIQQKRTDPSDHTLTVAAWIARIAFWEAAPAADAFRWVLVLREEHSDDLA